MMESLLHDYKAKVIELTQTRLRVASLEKELEDLERQFRGQPAEQILAQDDKTRDLEPRFKRLLSYIRELGGRAELRELVPKTGLSTSGTLAQIRMLQSLGLVRQFDRGVYELAQI